MPAMVSEAKKALLALFAVENIPLWYVCHPPPPGSKGKKPLPPSAKTYTVQQFNAVADSQLILTPVLEEVRVGPFFRREDATQRFFLGVVCASSGV